MVQIGYTMMSEHSGPRQLVKDVVWAEQVGFDFSVVSDHYFPWMEEQGTPRTCRACRGRPPRQPAVAAHVADAEEHLFPALADVCSPEQLDELGEQIHKARDKAPALPRPAVPGTPPGNRILAFRTRPTESATS